MITIVMSMAAKSSDLDNQISGANLQNNGHTPTSPSGQKGLDEMGHLAVPPPILHLSHQRGNHPLVTLGSNTVWEYV